MEIKTLMLGDTDISGYVKPLLQEGGNIQEVIDNLEKDDLTYEQYILPELENKLREIKYNPIDLSFLEKSSILKLEPLPRRKAAFFRKGRSEINRDIKVPSFSVYHFYGNNHFGVLYSTKKTSVDVDFIHSDSRDSHKRVVSKLINKHLCNIYSSEQDFEKGWGCRFSTQKEDILKYRDDNDEPLLVVSEFNGLIPKKTKRKVKKSLKDFEKVDIYIIAETKPEQWNTEYVANDPLVVGIESERAYLIDHFETTSLEKLLKDTYTKDKSN